MPNDAELTGVMVVPPYYWPLSSSMVVSHYKRVAESIDLGLMVYNNTDVRELDLSLETMQRLSKVENIVAIKECSHDPLKSERVAQNLQGKVRVLNGHGLPWEPFGRQKGHKGFITSIANFAPALALDMWEAEQDNNWQRALKIRDSYLPLVEYFLEDITKQGSHSYLTSILKKDQTILSLAGGPPRSPLEEVTGESLDRLKSVLSREESVWK